MKLKKLNSEKILSLTAMLVSITTLIVFLYQTNLIRKQQYMSVYPYLSMTNFGSNTNNYTFVLKNDGIGPAIIKSIEVKTKDGQTFNDIDPYVKSKLQRSDSVSYYHTNLSVGMLIPANTQIKIVENRDKKLSTSIRLFDILNKEGTTMVIKYESIYEEVWTITNQSGIPVKQK